MEFTILEEIENLQINCKKSNSGIISMRILLIIMDKLNINHWVIKSILGFCDRTEKTWLDRYAQHGISGLYDISRSGRPSFLSEEQKQEIKNTVEVSTKKEVADKIVSVEKIEDKIKKDFNVNYSKSGIYKVLDQIGLSKILPRPVHEKNDPEIMKKWLQEFPSLIKDITKKNKDKKIKYYFQDETRYGQKTIYTGIWAVKGSSVEFENQDGFLNSWIYGAANPATGEHFGLILPVLDSQNMQIFIDSFAKTLNENEHIIMVLDGSGAHKSKELNIPKNISFIFLPPYCPQLNPIERLWSWIKSHYLSFQKFSNIEEIIEKGAQAWTKLTSQIIKSVCACDYIPNI